MPGSPPAGAVSQDLLNHVHPNPCAGLPGKSRDSLGASPPRGEGPWTSLGTELPTTGGQACQGLSSGSEKTGRGWCRGSPEADGTAGRGEALLPEGARGPGLLLAQPCTQGAPPQGLLIRASNHLGQGALRPRGTWDSTVGDVRDSAWTLEPCPTAQAQAPPRGPRAPC